MAKYLVETYYNCSFKNLFTVCDSLSSLGFDFKHIFIRRRRRLTQPSIPQVFCLGTVASNAFTACANANISATPHRPVPSRPDPSFENFITEQKRRKVAAVDQLPLRCSLRPGIISRGAFLRGSRSWAPHESCRVVTVVENMAASGLRSTAMQLFVLFFIKSGDQNENTNRNRWQHFFTRN